MLAKGLAEAIAGRLGSPVESASALAGGDINDAFSVVLADGRRLFLKTHANAPPSMYTTEARGLAWLAEAGSIRVPKVLAVEDEAGKPAFLALELITPAPRAPRFDETFGRALATLHRHGATGYGLDHDNYIGRLPQLNGLLEGHAAEHWAAFYRDRRILPQLALAERHGLVAPTLRARFDRLFDVLDDRVGPPEPPARLHGDLWAGNLHHDGAGQPVLIDPAVYGGHREMDLAMMRLFGGFGPRTFAAYDEAWPPSADRERRIPLYQLYPLLVHVNLFGGGYMASVEAALGKLL